MNLDSETTKEFLRFIPAGIVNTLTDWSVLNLLLFLTKNQELFFYSVFKTFSFLTAATISYFLNKTFVFKASRVSDSQIKSFGLFVLISALGAVINTGTATLVFGLCSLQFLWCANLGAVWGTIVAALWNFIGYKKLVFRK
jgi:putative flippase GtrA